MRAVELIHANGTAIGATIAALAAVAGDTLAVKATEISKMVRLVQFWADVQVAGTGRIRSPTFHDNVQGLRFDTTVGDPRPLMPWGAYQRLYANDALSVELAGSAVAGDIETIALLLEYEDLPGHAPVFLSADEVISRIDALTLVENTLATGTAGGYSGGEAINTEFDQFHAGAKYALLGYLVDAECTSVGWRGADTGNLRIGGPGDETERELTADWFMRLSRVTGRPFIPVFSAENKAGILVDAVQDENGTDVTVTSIFAKLRA